MKAELYTNVALVRVPIKAGTDEYYLPQNVDWAKQKIDKMVLCAPVAACTDPIDGVTPVATAADIADMYINLYDANNREIMHDVSVENIVHVNNNVLRVDAALNLSLCRLYFTTSPAQDMTLLLYVYYQTRTEEYYELPNKSVTAIFDLAANEEKSLREIINTYVHALPEKIQGIIVWTYNEPIWITLRDYAYTYQMANIHSELARPDMGASDAWDTQAALFLVNDLDIDFEYSHVREAAGQATTQKITFLY